MLVIFTFVSDSDSCADLRTLKFELFEQEFFCLKEKSIRKLSFRERFCSFVSLILTMGDDTRWLIDNECAEEVTKYFIEVCLQHPQHCDVYTELRAHARFPSFQK